MGRLANVEHQESGLFWSMDNWIYSTINSVRLRWTPTGVLREPTGSNGGQWGVTQDNYGKVWFQAGASGMPGYFQFPVAYGNINYPEQFEPDLNITWGAPVLVADMQGGMNSVRMPDGSLARATGSAGNDVFRGDRLPKDMIGDYFYGEAVARIVRRLHPVKTDGLTQLRNVYPLSEFIRSTDPLFRPVDMTTAPDGTMYITDMYRGIIQESQWSGPGTYLRQRIDQYALDKVVRHGRVWRLTYEGMGRAHGCAEDVDRNGGATRRAPERPEWLVARHGAAAARPQTGQVGRAGAAADGEELDQPAGANPGALDARRPDGDRRSARPRADEGRRPADPPGAIRVSETLYKAGDRSLAADYKTLAKDADVDVTIQAMLTMNMLKVPDAPATIKAIGAGARRRACNSSPRRSSTRRRAARRRPRRPRRPQPLPPRSRKRSRRVERSTRNCASPATAMTAVARRRRTDRPPALVRPHSPRRRGWPGTAIT